MIELTRDQAVALFDTYERALAALAEAEALLWQLPDHPDRQSCILAHSRVMTAIYTGLRAPLMARHRDLQPQRPVGPPDTELGEDEQRLVDLLSDAQIDLIDRVLLADCGASWRKVARIVSTAWEQVPDELSEIPAGFYARRVRALVESGRLESQGNLDYMRFSEVRLLPTDPA